ncbi:MAG TPA: VIT domain-containing protein, partial [Bacteroidales bacterium]|nr:VIT domain-containing protein [Bacteroidales bacterium]
MKCSNCFLATRNALYPLIINAFLFFTGSCALSQEKSEGDETLSPYFFVQSDDPETDRMPLKSTDAKINIAGVIADVTIRQVYQNEGKNVLEAIYVFPASTRAAIYAMKMIIGEREINAVIQEKQLARQMYQEAKDQGKTASLLEQKRPNVFQMQVANILPGDNIVVELKYTELLIPESAIYQFVYPTVVGPRYCNQTESEAPEDDWISNPYLEEGKSPDYTFNLSVTL